MILYTENPKDATRKLIELINEFGKVTGCKINTQKSPIFLYSNNERSKREIKETFPFTITSKRIKYIGINLHNEAKDLYAENNNIQKKSKMIHAEGDIYLYIYIYIYISCFWTRRINIVKMTILPK